MILRDRNLWRLCRLVFGFWIGLKLWGHIIIMVLNIIIIGRSLGWSEVDGIFPNVDKYFQYFYLYYYYLIGGALRCGSLECLVVVIRGIWTGYWEFILGTFGWWWSFYWSIWGIRLLYRHWELFGVFSNIIAYLALIGCFGRRIGCFWVKIDHYFLWRRQWSGPCLGGLGFGFLWSIRLLRRVLFFIIFAYIYIFILLFFIGIIIRKIFI